MDNSNRLDQMFTNNYLVKDELIIIIDIEYYIDIFTLVL